MTYHPDLHHRRSIRLKGYDYTRAGAYYVTIVTQGRECLFGDVVDDQMRLNDAGRMVQSAWETLPERFPTVELDEFSIMPNHIHGIIVITNAVGATLVVAQPANDNDREHGVGATLVVAQHANDNDREHGVGATLVVAQPANDNDRERGVGATLVVALDDVIRAGTSPAPTMRGDGVDDAIRAGTIPAPTMRGGGLDDVIRAGTSPAPTGPTLGDIVGAFKSITTDEYIRGVHALGWPPFNKRIWQRNYHEHIIRDEHELDRIRQYIVNNPLQWTLDTENPGAKR